MLCGEQDGGRHVLEDDEAIFFESQQDGGARLEKTACVGYAAGLRGDARGRGVNSRCSGDVHGP